MTANNIRVWLPEEQPPGNCLAGLLQPLCSPAAISVCPVFKIGFLTVLKTTESVVMLHSVLQHPCRHDRASGTHFLDVIFVLD